jgi:hypothetical protein
MMVDGGGEEVHGPYFYSIDVARAKDWTWVCRWGHSADGMPLVIGMFGMRRMRMFQQIERCREYINAMPGEVIVDSTATGGLQFKDELERALGFGVIPFVFNSHDKEELMESAIVAVEQRRFQFRTDMIEKCWIEEAVTQFSNFECEIEDNGRYNYHGEPDDAPICVALGWHLAKWGMSGVGTSTTGIDYIEQLFG